MTMLVSDGAAWGGGVGLAGVEVPPGDMDLFASAGKDLFLEHPRLTMVPGMLRRMDAEK